MNKVIQIIRKDIIKINSIFSLCGKCDNILCSNNYNELSTKLSICKSCTNNLMCEFCITYDNKICVDCATDYDELDKEPFIDRASNCKINSMTLHFMSLCFYCGKIVLLCYHTRMGIFHTQSLESGIGEVGEHQYIWCNIICRLLVVRNNLDKN